MLIHLCTAYGCFRTTIAEAACPAKPKIFTPWPFNKFANPWDRLTTLELFFLVEDTL